MLQRRAGQVPRRRHVGLIRIPERHQEGAARLLILATLSFRVAGSTNDLYSPTVQWL